jgi:hypothetical protein
VIKSKMARTHGRAIPFGMIGTDCFTTVPMSRKMSAGWLAEENPLSGQIPLKILGYRALKLTAG